MTVLRIFRKAAAAFSGVAPALGWLLPLAALTAAVTFSAGALSPAAADTDFNRWVEGFWPVARDAGVGRDTYRRAFQGVTPDPDTIRLMNKQSEFVKPIWEYLGSAVSDTRVEKGREMLSAYAPQLAAIEQRYGVDRRGGRKAIWGMETNHGSFFHGRALCRARAGNALPMPRRAAGLREQGSWCRAEDPGCRTRSPTEWKALARRHGAPSSCPPAGAIFLRLRRRRSPATSGRTFPMRRVHRQLSQAARLAERQDLGLWRSCCRAVSIMKAVDEKRPSRPGAARVAARNLTTRPGIVLILRGASAAFRCCAQFVIKPTTTRPPMRSPSVIADRVRAGGPFALGTGTKGAAAHPVAGGRSADVKLNRRGFNGAADGRVGSVRGAGIRGYQRSVGLIPDGYASVACCSASARPVTPVRRS
ncbi:MAG: lytic murein transglycosylase [Alphaproteobacteria bacterium]|nr:lytic murein transglycosylase [Alphaproteobacteria bacterium]